MPRRTARDAHASPLFSFYPACHGRVREKEMNFYSNNLSMVGTQSALLAGFAFAILSQKDFTFPPGGFFPADWRSTLGMRTITFPNEYDWTEEQVIDGVRGWTWDVAFTQICQFFHLLLTTIGMSIQLWTLYTCVLTNILGLSLALRGPEGSVDRAVRHMAEQNQLVMNRFGYGVLIFFISIMLFSLMEYECYVSIPVCICVSIVFKKMIGNIRSLVNVFWLDHDTVVTGQFRSGDKRREARAAYKIRAQANARLRGEVVDETDKGWRQVGCMLTGRYENRMSAAGTRDSLPAPTVRDRADALKHLFSGRRGDAMRGANRRAGLREWAKHGQRAYRRGQQDIEDVQAPSAVVNKLITRTQDPAAIALAQSSDASLGNADDLGSVAGESTPNSMRSFRWEDETTPEGQRGCAASVMQAAVRAKSARKFSAAQSCMRLLQAESALGTRLDDESLVSPTASPRCVSCAGTPRGTGNSYGRGAGVGLGRDSEEASFTEASVARRQQANDSSMNSMPLFERLMGRFATPSENEQAAAVQLQSRVRGSLARQRSRELRLSTVTGVFSEQVTDPAYEYGSSRSSPSAKARAERALRATARCVGQSPSHASAASDGSDGSVTGQAAAAGRQAAADCLFVLSGILESLDLPCDPRRGPPQSAPDVQSQGDADTSPQRLPRSGWPLSPGVPTPPYVGGTQNETSPGARTDRRSCGSVSWNLGGEQSPSSQNSGRGAMLGGRRINCGEPGSRDGWRRNGSDVSEPDPSFSAMSSVDERSQSSEPQGPASGRAGLGEITIDIPRLGLPQVAEHTCSGRGESSEHLPKKHWWRK
tara:strand:- start:153 stop:2615 length:2463 start_codon:yes stop_codon:yes gene_type:complete